MLVAAIGWTAPGGTDLSPGKSSENGMVAEVHFATRLGLWSLGDDSRVSRDAAAAGGGPAAVDIAHIAEDAVQAAVLQLKLGSLGTGGQPCRS